MKKSYNFSIRVLSLFMGLMLSVSAFAQKTLTGVVSDAKGDGIPGVSVTIKGTKAGALTDVSGKYSVNVPANGSVAVFSSIGFKSQEIKIGGQSSINLTLEEDASTLSEVVVTGYTIDSRRETTGSISTVKPKDLAIRPSGNVEQQLQGRVAGVTLITNGQPGTSSQVRIRGFGSFGPPGSNDPLYVVDGVPTASTDFLSPDDIESVTVLKDAASASLYGARAANGVVIYTTKKGAKGAKKLNVEYSGMYGETNPGQGIAMMNPTDFMTWTNQAYKNSGSTYQHPQFGLLGGTATPTLPEYLKVGGKNGVTGGVDLTAEKAKYNVDPRVGSIYTVIKANKVGTDWYDAVTQTAPLQRHALGFSGGTDASRFYVGLSAQRQQGILIANDYTRYTFRANSEFNILKNLKFGENVQGTFRQVLGQTGENGGIGLADDENDILAAFRMPSIIPIYDEFGGYAGTTAAGFNNPRNPVANREGQLNNRNFNTGGFGNIYLDFEPIKGLNIRSTLGANYGNFYGFGYTRLQYENSENNSAFGYNENGGHSFAWNLTNTAQYKRLFGKHAVDVLAGQEALNTGKGRNINASGLDPFSWDPNYITMSNVGSRVVNSNFFKGVNFYSLFARANYSFNDKYILSGIVRRDGSSRFGANNRYGVFPAFSAAWRISSEEFMKSLTFINDLKIRGGYGTMGNSNPVDPNNQYSLFGANIGRSGYDINGSNTSVSEGYYRTRIGNPDARWETAITKNIGIDGNLFNGKLDVIVEFWSKDTKDLLLQLPIPATNGFDAAAPSVNIGAMQNKGVDITLGTRGKFSKDFTYDFSFTGGALKNELTEIAPGQTYISTINPGYRGLSPIRNQLGYSISSFYGYKVQGLFQNAEEVKSAATQTGAAPGRFRYEDINGDGKIDVNDRTYLGSPVPKFTAGTVLSFGYKAFDVVAQLNGVFGNKIFNASRWFTDFYPSFAGAAIAERVKESWTPSNTSATIPIFETASNFSTNTQASSYYIENGDYVRFQTVTLGYSMPSSVSKKLNVDRLRVFGSANNLFTLTKYSGLDPGVGGNADTNFGIDVGNYPMTSGWTIGVNLGF